MALSLPALGQERWASLSDQVFRRYTQDDGLPNPVVTAIAEDSDGFLWVGTEGGLARWDGYRFHTYLPDAADPGAIHDNWIEALHTDTKGRLWIGTSSGGLERYDRDHDRFITYPTGQGGLSTINILVIADDGSGKLWVGTDNGLNHVDPDTASVSVLRHVEGDPASLPDDHVTALARDESGALWVGTVKGLARRPAGGAGFVAVSLVGVSDHTVVSALFKDQDGRIWIGTDHHGAFVVDPGQTVPVPVHETSSNGGELAHQWVYAIAGAEPGRIWLGTYGQGIVTVDVASGQTTRIRNDPSLPRTLCNDTIWVMHRDRSGIMWVGTTDGLSRQDSQPGALLTAFGASGKPNRITEGDILSLLSTSDGHIWLGLRSKGIDIIDPVRGRIGGITPMLGDSEHQLPPVFVHQMAELPGGNVYLGTFRGLYRTDLSAKDISHVTIPGRDPQAGTPALLGAAGKLWIGGVTGGIWAVDPGFETERTPEHYGADALTDGRITTLVRGVNNDMWIGTRNGLNRMDLTSRAIERIPASPSDPMGLSAGYVPSMLVDQAGRLWVATLGGGIDVMVGRRNGKPVFHTIGIADGLPDTNVDSLLADRRGRIWAATDSGIAVVDPDNFTVHTLHRADGVAVPAYWAGAGAATTAGELLFGGIGAMTVIRPEHFQPWDYHPPVVVTEARVGHVSLPAGRFNGSDVQSPLVVPADANSLAIEFAALDFTAPEQNRYAYWLEGYDREWIDSDPTRRLADYTNLQPGTYTLHLRGSNRNGAWSQTELRLPVRVEPAWYQTVWCKMAEGLIVVGAVIALMQRRTAYLRHRQRELERQVAERTAELEQSKRQIEQIAYQDALTGLPNRRMFVADFQKHLMLESRRAGRFALLLIDLDHFKQVNDTLGHDAGDALLMEAACRLRTAVRHSDCLARLGGDEFSILLTDMVDIASVEAICERIIDSFRAPICFNGIDMRTSASIGIGLYPAHGATQDSLYKAADLALYEAKAAGRNTWRWHNPGVAPFSEFRSLQPTR